MQLIAKPSDDPIPLTVKIRSLGSAITEIYTGLTAHVSIEIKKIASPYLEAWTFRFSVTKAHTIQLRKEKNDIALVAAAENSLHFTMEDLGSFNLHERNFHLFFNAPVSALLHLTEGHCCFFLLCATKKLFNEIALTTSLANLLQRTEILQPSVYTKTRQVARPLLYSVLKSLFEETDPVFPGKRAGVFFQMVLAKKYSYKGKPPHLPQSDIDKIYRIKNFLFMNLKHHYTLKEIARKFELSQYKITSLFKSVYGITVTELLRERQMEVACKMLYDERNLSLKHIAEETGFINERIFLNVFRKCYGIMPDACRKKDEKIFEYSLIPLFLNKR